VHQVASKNQPGIKDDLARALYRYSEAAENYLTN